MTSLMIEALNECERLQLNVPEAIAPDQSQQAEPELHDLAVGKPISHGQLLAIWKALKEKDSEQELHIYTLEELLRGAKVYVPPLPAKVEPTDEYKQLMARLRREQEEREYRRMVDPKSLSISMQQPETFAQRFPLAPRLHDKGFGQIHAPTSSSDLGDDDVTYNEIHRQSMLVINFLVTILGSAGGLWVLARWWSTPARLVLTLFGSLLVGIAEVAVYSGYIWHLSEAKKKENKLVERKSVVETWVVGDKKTMKDAQHRVRIATEKPTDNIRQRKVGVK